MDRTRISERLGEVERTLASAVLTARRQRQLIADMQRDGLDTRHLWDILHLYEEMLAFQEGERDRVLRDIARVYEDPSLQSAVITAIALDFLEDILHPGVADGGGELEG